MLLLRQMPESEARELLTTQVASAGDLCGVLRWRIGRALAQHRRAARRAAVLPVDDDGARHLARQATEPRLNAERARLRPVRHVRRVEGSSAAPWACWSP
ncbi:hypothetical protein ACIBO5_40405 [Nonomuraea angiospora]|uniref:hypothetical protein n=1 Tax=Nonomuraea angiospora TaxID=46172 RepID=UPI0037A6CC61